MFEVVENKQRCVRDLDAKVEMSLTTAPESYCTVNVIMGDDRRISFAILLEPKPDANTLAASSSKHPTIKIFMGSLRRVATFLDGSFKDNTDFVRLILRGLSKLNELWPLTKNQIFYSDRLDYVGRESIFPFELPSEEDISRL